MSKRRKGRAGFTMVEMMTVILLIFVLAAMVVGISGYVTRKGAEAQARAELQQLRNALEEYRIETGSYPGDLDGLGDYGEGITSQDPWGAAYVYRPRGGFSYELFSRGPSGDENVPDNIR
jgi:general secretion pathway protein G